MLGRWSLGADTGATAPSGTVLPVPAAALIRAITRTTTIATGHGLRGAAAWGGSGSVTGQNANRRRATFRDRQVVDQYMTTTIGTRSGASLPGGAVARQRPDGGTHAHVDFDEFVLARSAALLRTAYLLTHDHALAEDLLQASLAKAWFAWERIDQHEAYVRRILVTTYATWWRRRWNGEHATEELPEPRAGAGAADPTEGVGQRHDLWTAMERLPRRQRAVVVLRYFEDLTEAQTASRPRLLGRHRQEPDVQGVRQAAHRPVPGPRRPPLRHHPHRDRGPLMSTVDDLRSTLEDHAHGVQDPGATPRVVAVHERVRGLRRRRRTAAGALAAVVALAGVGIGVQVLGDRQTGPEPAGAPRTLADQEVPATVTILGRGYDYVEGIDLDTDERVATVRLPRADAPRAVSLAASGLGDGAATLRALRQRGRPRRRAPARWSSPVPVGAEPAALPGGPRGGRARRGGGPGGLRAGRRAADRCGRPERDHPLPRRDGRQPADRRRVLRARRERAGAGLRARRRHHGALRDLPARARPRACGCTSTSTTSPGGRGGRASDEGVEDACRAAGARMADPLEPGTHTVRAYLTQGAEGTPRRGPGRRARRRRPTTEPETVSGPGDRWTCVVEARRSAVGARRDAAGHP